MHGERYFMAGARPSGWRKKYLGALMLSSGLCLAPAAGVSLDLTSVTGGTGGYIIRGTGFTEVADMCLGAGDVNGDGLADSIIYTRSLGNAAGVTAPYGAAVVVFGKVSNVPRQLSAVLAGNGGFVIRGARNYSRYSSAAAPVGDFNGDGLDDIAVGCVPYGSNAGAAVVVFGKSDGAPVEVTDILAGGTQGFGITGYFAGNLVGTSVSGAGDVNGDGYDDMMFGTLAPFVQAGVVFGGTQTGSALVSNLGYSTGGILIYNSNSFFDLSTDVVGAGDMNGDGLDDVALTMYDWFVPGAVESHVFVVYGKENSGYVDLNNIDTGMGGGFVVDEVQVDDYLGSDLGPAGDVNGDGLADLVITATGTDRDSTGPTFDHTYVLLGKSDDLRVQASDLEVGVGGFTIIDDQSNKIFHDSRGIGDHNGDGFSDIVIGGHNHLAPPTPSAVFVVNGDATPSNVMLSSIVAGTGGYRITRTDPTTQWLGYANGAAGDVNGDGLADLIVADRTSFAFAGAAWIVHGQGSPSTTTYMTNNPEGNSPLRAVGEVGDKSQYPPDSRAWIGFTGGSGPGLSDASSVAVTLDRSDASVTGLGPNSANVDAVWTISTDRTDWTEAQLAFKYTNAELGSIPEASLKIFTQASPGAPWSVLPSTVNTASNTVSGTVPASVGLGRFVLRADTSPPTVLITKLTTERDRDYTVWTIDFNEPVAPTFTASDLTVNGVPGIPVLTGSDLTYTAIVAYQDIDQNGTASLSITGSVKDLVGRSLVTPASSPPHLVFNFSPADVNKDEVVDLADVALIGDANLGLLAFP